MTGGPVRGDRKLLGTIVCVVMKAKNLPNKKSIGKQDPYCVLQLNQDVNKTKPDKRGGQHPHWDEQLHFDIHEDMGDQARNGAGPSSLSKASSPQKAALGSGPSTLSTATARKPSKSRTLRVACYADDTKEPEFIGEGTVDLTETLTKGEFDDWVILKAKNKYAGEVYLELTFYSSGPAPRRKKVTQPQMAPNTVYGGTGTFTGDIDDVDGMPRPPPKQAGHAPIPSAFVRQSPAPGAPQGHGFPLQAVPHSASHARNLSTSASTSFDGTSSMMRPSSSLALMESYTPPYAAQNLQRSRSPSFPQAQHAPPERSNTYDAPGRVQLQGRGSQHDFHASESSISGQFFREPPSYISESSSAATIRPGEAQWHGSAMDDLVGGMSSMSVHPGAQRQSSQSFQGEHEAPYNESMNSSLSHHALSAIPPSHNVPRGGALDQYGRPLQPTLGYQSSTHLSHPRNGEQPPLPTPTPPPAPSSAPPLAAYPNPSTGPTPPPAWPLHHTHSFNEPSAYSTQNVQPTAPTWHHQQAPQPQYGVSSSPYLPQRTVSPSPSTLSNHSLAQPARGPTPGAYHNLPPPPPTGHGASWTPSQSGPFAKPPPPQPPVQNGRHSPLPASTSFIQSPYARAPSTGPTQGHDEWTARAEPNWPSIGQEFAPHSSFGASSVHHAGYPNAPPGGHHGAPPQPQQEFGDVKFAPSPHAARPPLSQYGQPHLDYNQQAQGPHGAPQPQPQYPPPPPSPNHHRHSSQGFAAPPTQGLHSQQPQAAHAPYQQHYYRAPPPPAPTSSHVQHQPSYH